MATRPADNPAAQVAEFVGVPKDTLISQLQLPNKLIFFGSYLGLGDIVVPGLLVALALRRDRALLMGAGSIARGSDSFDELSSPSTSRSVSLSALLLRATYFRVALSGYAVGMMATSVALNWSQHAQPALLYLIPCTLLPLMVVAWRTSDLYNLWRGVGVRADAD